MEILSPGDLPNVITIDNIREKRYARNPIISRTLTELGLVKELNEGVSRIYREMSEFFLEDPIYTEEKGLSLRLTLKNNVIMRSKRNNENLLKNGKINQKLDELNVMEQKIMQMLFDKGESKTSEIAEFIDRDRKTAQRLLKKLCDDNLIEWIGTSNKDPRKVYRIKR